MTDTSNYMSFLKVNNLKEYLRFFRCTLYARELKSDVLLPLLALVALLISPQRYSVRFNLSHPL